MATGRRPPEVAAAIRAGMVTRPTQWSIRTHVLRAQSCIENCICLHIFCATRKFNLAFSIDYVAIQRHDEEEEGAELGQLEGAVQVHGRKDVLQGLQEEVQWRGESLDSFTCSKFEAIWQSIFPLKGSPGQRQRLLPPGMLPLPPVPGLSRAGRLFHEVSDILRSVP